MPGICLGASALGLHRYPCCMLHPHGSEGVFAIFALQAVTNRFNRGTATAHSATIPSTRTIVSNSCVSFTFRFGKHYWKLMMNTF